MTIEAIENELATLALDRWDEDVALELGHILTGLARERDLPVVIDIRCALRSYFHAALPGSTAINDLWALRKSNVTLMMGRASLVVGLANRGSGKTLADEGLPSETHADHGGAVPLRVGTMMVAVATVSGLPEREDHALVVEGLKALLG